MPIPPEKRYLYGPDWERRSQEIRFGRAGGRCECHGQCGRGHKKRCKAYHGDTLSPGGRLFEGWGKSHAAPPRNRKRVVLTVAHLDHHPENNRSDNLKALCQRCHLAYDTEQHQKTKKRNRRQARERQGQRDFTTENTEENHAERGNKQRAGYMHWVLFYLRDNGGELRIEW